MAGLTQEQKDQFFEIFKSMTIMDAAEMKNRIKDELGRIKGVGSVTIFGAGDYSMRVWLDPRKLKARNLTTEDVVGAIQEQNVQVAAGRIGAAPAPPGTAFQFTINALGRLDTVEQFGDIIVKRTCSTWCG